MRFELTPEQAAWREEVRAFLREHLTPDVEAELATPGSEGRGPLAREFIRKLGARGWWGVAWPKELGGLGRSACEQYLFIEELEYAFAPSLHLTVTSVAPTILRVGSEALKREWIPRILRGEVDFAIGYSEPEAGTDLASLQTRAVEDGDTWVIDGQKIWNTGAAHATHEWLACRTEPAAPRHRGISLFIVPLDAPGITIQSMETWGGFPTYQVFFDGVRVPRANLVGERGRGWEYMTMALDFERVAMGSVGGPRRLLDDLFACCRATVVGGRPLADDPVVRAALAELDVEVEAARLLGWLNAWTVDQGRVPVREASMVKVASSEVRQKVCDVGLRLLGLYGLVGEGPWAPLGGRLQRMYRASPVWRFGGGTNEVQRSIIAQHGLGLPRG
jgi:alkylation response protein AidB-like acyl-CoA dehydrogenase